MKVNKITVECVQSKKRVNGYATVCVCVRNVCVLCGVGKLSNNVALKFFLVVDIYAFAFVSLCLSV